MAEYRLTILPDGRQEVYTRRLRQFAPGLAAEQAQNSICKGVPVLLFDTDKEDLAQAVVGVDHNTRFRCLLDDLNALGAKMVIVQVREGMLHLCDYAGFTAGVSFGFSYAESGGD